MKYAIWFAFTLVSLVAACGCAGDVSIPFAHVVCTEPERFVCTDPAGCAPAWILDSCPATDGTCDAGNNGDLVREELTPEGLRCEARVEYDYATDLSACVVCG